MSKKECANNKILVAAVIGCIISFVAGLLIGCFIIK